MYAPPPRFLVPARDARHRIACLALYRALLQLAPRVSLPDDLATAWGPANPIAVHIRRAFRRNCADTSPRIVNPALKAGYRMLSALKRASQSTPSDDHASILAFLRSRLHERQRSHAARANAPDQKKTPKPGAPREGTIPLLVNVTPPATPENPYPKPQYAIPSRPRLVSELGGTGKRKVPRLDMASDFPFLRLSKPQPALLSRVLTQKIKTRVKRGGEAMRMAEEVVPESELEDRWEMTVAQLIREEQQDQLGLEERAIRADLYQGETYKFTHRTHGVKHLQKLMSREREDQVARANAMRLLIIEEAKLAKQEKEKRDAESKVRRRRRWEEKMEEQHGPTWRELFPDLDSPKAKTEGALAEAGGGRAHG
ncbi:hypothetical protein F5X99DRAFT_335216 [Biscogniauxia marginata]|nr:hypothetical protein F5X99DRAFT_335216 [Biscogniauxia marginata]